jgi:hemolysin III
MASLPTWAPGEEFVNTLTHAIAAILSTVASFFVIRKQHRSHDTSRLVAAIIFSITTIQLYFVSALYHGLSNVNVKKALRVVDHSSVFSLIAGVYTAYGLSALKGHWGFGWMGGMWSIALLGCIGKIFFFDLVEPFSTFLYVLQGWLCVISFRTMSRVLTKRSINWLIAGGIMYTIGALVFLVDKPFVHAVFHVVMMGGTACHIVSFHFYT